MDMPAVVMLPMSPSVYMEGSLCCLSQVALTTGILVRVTLCGKPPPRMHSSSPILNSLFVLDVFAILISFHLRGEGACVHVLIHMLGDQRRTTHRPSLSYSLRQFLSLNLEPQ